MKFISIKDLYFLLVITLIKVVSWFFSPKLKDFVVKCIASSAYLFSREKRRLSEKNLSQAFGEKLTEDQKQKIIKEAFNEFWMEAFSLILSNFERDAIKGVGIHGVEHLQQALKKGKGVILWESVSFGRRNLAKQILKDRGFSIHQVHADYHIAGFRHDRKSPTYIKRLIIKPFFDRHEKQFIEEIINIPDSDSLAYTRLLLHRLKQNAIICITADVGLGQKLIPQRFFGRSILFPTGMVSLARLSGATILPIFCIKEKNNEIILIIENPIPVASGTERDSNLENSISQYASLLESYIRRFPENHRSWHYLGRLEVQSSTIEILDEHSKQVTK